MPNKNLIILTSASLSEAWTAKTAVPTAAVKSNILEYDAESNAGA